MINVKSHHHPPPTPLTWTDRFEEFILFHQENAMFFGLQIPSSGVGGATGEVCIFIQALDSQRQTNWWCRTFWTFFFSNWLVISRCPKSENSHEHKKQNPGWVLCLSRRETLWCELSVHLFLHSWTCFYRGPALNLALFKHAARGQIRPLLIRTGLTEINGNL